MSAPAGATPVIQTARPTHGVELTGLLAWVETRLRAWSGQQGTLVLTVPAPVAEPEVLLETLPGPYGFFWQPPGESAWVGAGAVHVLRSDSLGAGRRFRSLEDAAADLWRGLEVESWGCEAETPRLFGGFAFSEGAAASAPWEDFGDGAFTLPRWLLSGGEADTRLSLAVEGEELRSEVRQHALMSELRRLLGVLANPPQKELSTPRVLAIEPPEAEIFEAQVEAIRRAIASGEVEKIVAAGRSRVRLDHDLEVGAVLRRLRRGQGAGSVTRFAFLREHSTFLGLTPERLISRRGDTVTTEALAGSIASGEAAARLLDSGKDRREHQLVVDAIERQLAPLCQDLDVPDMPRIRELRDVLHLHTPIRGTLDAPRHVLELVEALHPTPAVGGVPTQRAMRWIAEHEGDPRGWYAAPVGWFDAAGDGDFAVALRSCVLRGRDAYLYAGAGIVRDSNPHLEYQETELKKLALLHAFGA